MRYSLTAFLISIYILSIGSRLYSSDAQAMYETARALAFQQTIALSEDFGLPQIRLGADGRYYSQYDPGLPLVAAPLVWLGDQIAGANLWHRYAFSAYLLLWISALGVALGLSLFFYNVAQNLYGAQIALMLVILAAFATPLWVYARLFFAEGLLSGLVMAAFWGLWRGDRRGIWLASVALGLAILTRPAVAIYTPSLLWLIFRTRPHVFDLTPQPPLRYPSTMFRDASRQRGGAKHLRETLPSKQRGRAKHLNQNLPFKQRGGAKHLRETLPSKQRGRAKHLNQNLPSKQRGGAKHLREAPLRLRGGVWGGVKKCEHLFIFFSLPTLAALGLLYHNQLRWGDALTFGYAGQHFDTPLWVGVAGLLFSPGKSVFVYAPILILSLFGWGRFWRKEPALAQSILIATLSAFLFYGQWWAWGGGWCWGPRLLVPIMPLWMLPLGAILEDARRPLWALVGVLGVVGMLINGAGVITDVNRTYSQAPHEDMVHYTLRYTPISGAFQQLSAGQTEPLGSFQMERLGWTIFAARLFPISLLLLALGSAFRIRQLMQSRL